MEDYREAYILDTVEQLCTRTPEAGTVHKPECLKSDPIPAQRRDLAMQSRTYLQSYWWLWSSEKRRVSVLWECRPGKLNLIAVGGHTSQNICAAQIDFDGVKNRTELSRWGREIWEGMSEGWLQSKHIIQNSQINNKNITNNFISRYFKTWWSLVVYKLRSLSTNQSPFRWA